MCLLENEKKNGFNRQILAQAVEIIIMEIQYVLLNITQKVVELRTSLKLVRENWFFQLKLIDIIFIYLLSTKALNDLGTIVNNYTAQPWSGNRGSFLAFRHI